MTIERLMTFLTFATAAWLLAYFGAFDTDAWASANDFFATAKASLNITVLEDTGGGLMALMEDAHSALQSFLTRVLTS